MLFWALIILTAAAVALVIGLSFRRGGGEVAGVADMALYRDQLAEVGRDEARGVLAADEAARVRVEVSRRLLEADRTAQAATASRRGPLAPAILIAALVAGSALVLYQRLGAPDYPDWPRQARLEAAREGQGRPAAAGGSREAVRQTLDPHRGRGSEMAGSGAAIAGCGRQASR